MLYLFFSEWDEIWEKLEYLRVILEYPHIKLHKDNEIDVAVELFYEKARARSVFVHGAFGFLAQLQRDDTAKISQLLKVDDQVNENDTVAEAPQSSSTSHMTTPPELVRKSPDITTPNTPVKRRVINISDDDSC